MRGEPEMERDGEENEAGGINEGGRVIYHTYTNPLKYFSHI